jgi:outer membrane receptor protein involved in Fe transport
MVHSKLRLLTALFFLAVSALVMADGPQTGNIEGRVTDNENNPLPGVVINLESPLNNKSTVTNENGVFRFPLLIAGDYEVTASMTGMRSVKVPMRVNVGKKSPVMITLVPDTYQESLVVTGSTPLVDKSNVSTGGNVDSETFDNVGVGRSYQSVVQLMPGVGDGGNPNVNGALDGDNVYLVDGMDTTDNTTGTFGINLNYDAIAEVEVVTGAISAEYGRAQGAVINIVTKSGSNEYEGSIRWVLENEDWNSNSDRFPFNQEDEIKDIPTYTLGGPILKDKLWFFGTYESGVANTSQVGIANGQSYTRDFENTYENYKFTFAPTESHTIQASYSSDPATVPVPYWGASDTGDFAAVNLQSQGGEFYTVRWDWIATDNLVTQFQYGTQDSGITVGASPFGDPDPSLAPGFYWDLNNDLGYNAPVFDGAVERPRDQASFSATWYAPFGHEIKVGLDWQETESTNRFDRYGNARHHGYGFNRNAPGGFDDPWFLRVYTPSDPLTSVNTQTALFVIDRFDLNENWSFNLGFRVEQQEGDNDAGESVIDTTDIAPRLSAVYDINGDGRLLATASYGRYYAPVIQSLVDEFNRGITSSSIYEDYNWNPETNAYDIFDGRVDTSGNNRAIESVDPYYEDEWIIGVEWQFAPIWAAKAKYINSKVDNIFDLTTDYDAQGNTVSMFQTVDDAERKYSGIQLEVERRLRNNWQFAANYVLGEAEGNFFSETNDTFGNYRSTTDLAVRNRYGKAPYDVEQEIKAWGVYFLELGSRNVVKIGANLNWQTGTPWARTQTSQVPGVDGQLTNDTVTEFLERRGSRTLGSIYELDMSVTWEFSFWRSLRSSLQIQAYNVTDQQKQVGVNSITGQANNTASAYQDPRSMRIIAGLRF